MLKGTVELDEWRELCEGSVNYLVYGNIHHLLGCLYSSFLSAAVLEFIHEQVGIFLNARASSGLLCIDEGVVASRPKPRGMQ